MSQIGPMQISLRAIMVVVTALAVWFTLYAISPDLTTWVTYLLGPFVGAAIGRWWSQHRDGWLCGAVLALFLLGMWLFSFDPDLKRSPWVVGGSVVLGGVLGGALARRRGRGQQR